MMSERDQFAGSFAFNDDEPTALLDGDFWVDGTSYNVYARTGGQTVNLTDLSAGPALFNQSGAGTFLDNSGISNVGGYASAGNVIGTVIGSGSFAHGHVIGTTHGIYANGDGSIALGKVVGMAGGVITSSGDGSFSGGYINSANDITASEDGSFAWGKAYGSPILSSDVGSFAGGYAHTNAITASGSGSFAWGHADSSSIAATATNAFQFGPGSNSQADSLQIGTSVRFKGSDGAFSSPADGDFWEASNEVFVRSDGRDRSFSKISATLDVDTTNVGNVGTGVDDLITFTVPAATLATNDDSLEVICMGTVAANGATKEIRFVWGAAEIVTSTALAQNGGSWYIKVHIIRTGAATQNCVAHFSTDGTTFVQRATFVLATETLSGAVVIKCTGEATSNDDIIQTAMITKLIPG